MYGTGRFDGGVNEDHGRSMVVMMMMIVLMLRLRDATAAEAARRRGRIRVVAGVMIGIEAGRLLLDLMLLDLLLVLLLLLHLLALAESRKAHLALGARAGTQRVHGAGARRRRQNRVEQDALLTVQQLLVGRIVIDVVAAAFGAMMIVQRQRMEIDGCAAAAVLILLIAIVLAVVIVIGIGFRWQNRRNRLRRQQRRGWQEVQRQAQRGFRVAQIAQGV